MADIAKVKEIMEACSMPLELTIEEFKEQALDMVTDDLYKFSKVQTNEDIINCIKGETVFYNTFSISLKNVRVLIKALLERYDKPSESIDDIETFEDMFYLIRHGLVFISEEERIQREQGTPQYIDELLGELNDVITNSQQEIKELEEERDKLVEEINQKRNQMLQGIEALRSRLAELGADCENILPKKDERIREME